MTNEIVFIGIDGQAVTTSLAIAEGTQNQHASVLRIIRDNVDDFEGDFGRVRFEIRPFETAGGTQKREVAILNEQQATLLLTYMRNNEVVKGFKKHLVKSFFDIREKFRNQVAQPIAIPQTLPEALRLAADLAEKNQKLLEEQKVNAPKVEYCDQIVADNGAMTITKAAKVIGYPPRKFKDYIRLIGWLYANADTPMQHVITSGYMVLRYAHWTDNEGNYVEKPYAHITAKGMFVLYQRMRKEGLIEKHEQLELAA